VVGVGFCALTGGRVRAVSPYVRKVPTKSKATAVQIVWSKSHGSAQIEHVGSAHDQAGVEVLVAAARQRIHAGQGELPLGGDMVDQLAVAIVGLRMGRLLDALAAVYRQLGSDRVGDDVFEQLVTARIIEPTSKQDVGRVLAEAGMPVVSYATIRRRLPGYAEVGFRDRLSGVLAARAQLGSSALCLYDVTTLYFETDRADGFREPGFSKERRLEPQITVGLLSDASGMPLMVDAFEGNKAETKTMIPTIARFVAGHGIAGVTVLADAGMLSEQNLKQIEDIGWSFVVGGKIPEVPYAICQWHDQHPGETLPDGLIVSQQTFMGLKTDLRRRQVHYQYRADRARRTLRGIDEQISKAERTAAGQTQTGLKRNRFLTLAGGKRTVNRQLEAKARKLAGWKAYVTNLDVPAETVIGWYHQLWHVEHAFRMSKHDLRARPIYHHQRESIQAHLTIVMAALAVSKRIEQLTGWTISRFIKTFRTYRQATLTTGTQTLTAEQPIPNDLQTILNLIHQPPPTH